MENWHIVTVGMLNSVVVPSGLQRSCCKDQENIEVLAASHCALTDWWIFTGFNFPFSCCTVPPHPKEAGTDNAGGFNKANSTSVNVLAWDKHGAVVTKSAALGCFPKQSWHVLPLDISPEATLRLGLGTKKSPGHKGHLTAMRISPQGGSLPSKTV